MASGPAPASRDSLLPLPLAPLLGFGLAVIAVILVALVSNSTLEARTAAADAVSHSLEVLQESSDMLSALKDAETGQRGYLLTGEGRFLDTYYQGRDAAARAIGQLTRSLAADTEDRTILEDIRATTQLRLGQIAQTIELRKAGKSQEALQIVITEGQVAMDRLRDLTAQLGERVRTRLAARQRALEIAQDFSVTFTWGSSAVLLILIAFAAVMASRDFRGRERLAWVRAGQAGLSTRIQGEQRLETLGQEVVDYLCGYLGARVGVIYLVEDDGRLRRFGAHALEPGSGDADILLGEGLAGQAARDNAIRILTDVPEGYLPVASGVGRASPRGGGRSRAGRGRVGLLPRRGIRGYGGRLARSRGPGGRRALVAGARTPRGLAR
jgi:CHASE3 domain sensor protein